MVLLARSEDRLKQVARGIFEDGARAHYHVADLSDPKICTQAVESILNDIGTPDILINNAGAGRWLTVEETGYAELESMMAVPYFAAFNITKTLLPHMRKRGSGHIVNVSSVASHLVWPGAAGYSAARAALSTFSRALETELLGSQLHVTLAMFGKVSSPYWEHNPGSENRLPYVDKHLPTLEPQQVASSVLKGIERNTRQIVMPRIFRLIFILNCLFPRITQRVLRIGWRGTPNNRMQ